MISNLNIYVPFYCSISRYAELQRSRSQASQEKKSSSKRKTPSTSSDGENRERDITDTPKRPRVTARRRLQEQREKLMGAMALIELAEQMPGLWPCELWPGLWWPCEQISGLWPLTIELLTCKLLIVYLFWLFYEVIEDQLFKCSHFRNHFLVVIS